MTEQAKTEQLSPGCDSPDATTSCYPLRNWSSYPDFGLQPVVLELGNLPHERRWPQGCSPWLNGYYAPSSPLFAVPSCVVGTPQNSSPNDACSTEQYYKWRVVLDMTHFAPSEISVSVQEGFLVIGGSHSERPDVFGFTARCFTRKYRLPVGIDVSKVTSAMSGDGILCVEAPLPDTYSIPADIVIPVQVEKETIGGHEMPEDHKEACTPGTHTENGEPQQSEPTAPPEQNLPTEPGQPGTEAPGHGEEDSPLAGDDTKQQEEEVNGTTPSGEPRPLAPADEEGTGERFPEPSEHSQAALMDNQDNNTASSTEEPRGKEETLETDAESRETQPTAAPAAPSDPQAAAAEDHGEDAAHPGSASAAGDLQEHEEGTGEKDAEALAKPHPAPTPAAASADGAAEGLPEPPPPPEHRDALGGQDSPAAGTAATASAEPAHNGEIQPGEEEQEATEEEITQEDLELLKGLSQDLLDLALAPAMKQ